MIPPILPKIILALRKDGEWWLEDGLEKPVKALADRISKKITTFTPNSKLFLCVAQVTSHGTCWILYIIMLQLGQIDTSD